MSRRWLGVGLIVCGAIGCGEGRPPPPRGLACNDDPECSGALPGGASASERDEDYLALCTESDEGEPASASVGFFSDSIDPTNLEPFADGAAVYGRSRSPGALTCAEANAGTQFALFGAAREPGPLRVQPLSGNASFAATVLNRVDFQELPLIVPVFARDVVNDIFVDLGVARDPELGTIVIEVLEPPGFFDAEARPRHAGSHFELENAEAVGYRVNGRWTLDASATSDEGLAILINVPAAPGLGTQVDAIQSEEATDTSLDRYLWVASGAMTFAAMPPAL